MKKQAPHPKQQSFLANRQKTPLQDRQQAHQFMRSFLNIYNVFQSKPQEKNHNNTQPLGAQYPLAYHFLKVPPQKQELFTLRQKQNLQQGVLHGVDTTLTKEDEESQYQNYLKEYQTVVKNSRKQEYVSPVAQKEEMDELITEFLSGLQEHSRIHDRPTQPIRTAEKKKQKKQSEQIFQEEIQIRVEKIDLTNRKPKTDKKPALKNTGLREGKKEVTPIKQINLQEYLSAEVKSPRFQSKIEPKIIKIKSPKKQPEMKKIQYIKVQDLREKNSHSRVIPVLQAKQTQIPKKNSNDTSYTNAKSMVEKDSYLKKNLHKTTKNQKHSQTEASSQTKKQGKDSLCLLDSEPHNKKPIKIQIEIPLQQYSLLNNQERIQEYDVESHIELHQEETQIIRQISQKVLSLIQKTKHITPQKN